MTRAAALALALAAPAVARAGAAQPPVAASPPPASPPDDAAIDQASDANFDEDAPHHGFVIAAALGVADQVAFGRVEQASGTGFGVSFRLGAAASRRVSLLFAIDSTNYVAQIDKNPAGVNTSQVFSLGPQIYLRQALWLRWGLGVASFQRRAASSTTPERVFAGPGGQAGVGLELHRWGRYYIDGELTLVGAIYREGFVSGGYFGLGIGYD